MKKNRRISCCALALGACSAALLATTPVVHGQAVAASGAASPLANRDASTPPVTMRLKPYVITDDQGFKGMEVLRGVMPVDWTVKGGVTWKMALGVPNQLRLHWGDAQDVCAFDMYPRFYSAGATRWDAAATISRGRLPSAISSNNRRPI